MRIDRQLGFGNENDVRRFLPLPRISLLSSPQKRGLERLVGLHSQTILGEHVRSHAPLYACATDPKGLNYGIQQSYGRPLFKKESHF